MVLFGHIAMALAIVCTIGLPGSGKTTLCRSLATSSLMDNGCCGGSVDQLKYILISFDDLQQHSAPELTSAPELSQTDPVLTPYKLFRRSVQSLIESLIRHIQSGEQLLLPERFASLPLHHHITCLLGSIGSTTSHRICLLLDDNMYYRSMRYPYYQLARKYGLGYGQIFFNTKIDVCMERNRHRHGEQQIDEQVIFGMGEKLEPPNQALNSWEALSLEITDTSVVSPQLIRFMSSCLANVALPLMADGCEREARIGADDVVHQSDLILRQLVKKYISSRPGGEELKQCAAKANRCRKSLLTHLRCHSGELSNLLSDAASSADQCCQSSLHQFIEESFSKRVGTS